MSGVTVPVSIGTPASTTGELLDDDDDVLVLELLVVLVDVDDELDTDVDELELTDVDVLPLSGVGDFNGGAIVDIEVDVEVDVDPLSSVLLSFGNSTICDPQATALRATATTVAHLILKFIVNLR